MNSIKVDERVFLTFVPTPTGFDIVIPEGITPTEAALKFIELVREHLPKSTTQSGVGKITVWEKVDGKWIPTDN